MHFLLHAHGAAGVLESMAEGMEDLAAVADADLSAQIARKEGAEIAAELAARIRPKIGKQQPRPLQAGNVIQETAVQQRRMERNPPARSRILELRMPGVVADVQIVPQTLGAADVADQQLRQFLDPCPGEQGQQRQPERGLPATAFRAPACNVDFSAEQAVQIVRGECDAGLAAHRFLHSEFGSRIRGGQFMIDRRSEQGPDDAQLVPDGGRALARCEQVVAESQQIPAAHIRKRHSAGEGGEGIENLAVLGDRRCPAAGRRALPQFEQQCIGVGSSRCGRRLLDHVALSHVHVLHFRLLASSKKAGSLNIRSGNGEACENPRRGDRGCIRCNASATHQTTARKKQ